MKKMLNWLPFVLVLLIVFGLQVKWEADDRALPFPEPFGREQHAGLMTPNRPPQVLNDGRFVWLNDDKVVIASIEPKTQKVKSEERPVPQQDIYEHTAFQLVGDDIYWIGKDAKLLHATWQGSAWSQPQEIGQQTTALSSATIDGQQLLLVGTETEIQFMTVDKDGLHALQVLPAKNVQFLQATPDSKHQLEIGVLEAPAGETYRLRYLTYDPAQKKLSSLQKVADFHVDSSVDISDVSFGLDQTHGYFLLTDAKGRSGSKELTVYTFPLDHPSQSQLLRKPEWRDAFTAFGYALPGQGQDLSFVYVGDSYKNPRVNGVEVFLGHLQDGQWKAAKEITNLHKQAQNPILSKQGDHTVLLFTVATSFEGYDVYDSSDDKAYVAATNKITSQDYTNAALQVPQYLGIAAIMFFMALAWPILSYLYLLYFIVKKENELYDRPDRHLLVGVVLNYLSQAFVFLKYSKMEHYYTYAPAWMHGTAVLLVIFLVFAVLSYLATKMFGKLRYERNAIVEYSYFYALNTWMTLLGFSYFMAA